jgi:pimeloyl-ACP methyl ester carboxylesterase
MTTREQDVRLADGRVLRVLDTGPADGDAVLVCQGTPASRRLHDGWVTAAAAGLRLISYDRPGYGSSSPQPGRTIADTASDVAAIADDLGLDRFAVWGPSAGGPHALACAALLADRVVAAAVVAPYAPYSAPGLDFFAGMSEGGTQLLKLATAGRDALQQVLPQAAEAVRKGATTTWRWSPPGAWAWKGCGCRSRSGSASRTGRCRPLTAAGSPMPSPAPSCGCCLARATSRSSSDATGRSSTGSLTSCAVTADPALVQALGLEDALEVADGVVEPDVLAVPAVDGRPGSAADLGPGAEGGRQPSGQCGHAPALGGRRGGGSHVPGARLERQAEVPRSWSLGGSQRERTAQDHDRMGSGGC